MENKEKEEGVDCGWGRNNYSNGEGKVRELFVSIEKVPQKRIDEVRRGRKAWGKIVVPPMKLYDLNDEDYNFFLKGEKTTVVNFGESKILRF